MSKQTCPLMSRQIMNPVQGMPQLVETECLKENCGFYSQAWKQCGVSIMSWSLDEIKDRLADIGRK